MTGTDTGLLLDVQRRLEGFYGLDPQPPVTNFLLDAGAAAGYPGAGSRVLVTEDGDGLALGVVLEPAVLERLGRDDPRVRLDHGNLGDLCTVTEEVLSLIHI